MRISRLSRSAPFQRKKRKRPLFRPWALVVPIGVLVVCLPLLRPLRHTVPADDERLRLATIESILDHHTLALPAATPDDPQQSPDLVRVNGRLYADQPPLFSAILAGPAWLIRKLGWDLVADPEVVAYALTLLCVTLPVAGAGDLIYRMGRLFELSRPWRCLLAATVIVGSGLLSYATVLNAQAPAAALLIASAASLVHVEATKHPRRMAGWILLAGFCAALAMGLDPITGVIAMPLLLVLAVTRFSLRFRMGGVLLFLIGALPVLAAHAALNRPITGDLLPPSIHRELLARGVPPVFERPPASPTEPRGSSVALPEEDADDVIGKPGMWMSFATTCQWLTTALVGEHGLLSHYPILLLGVGGVGAVMHRHWPAPIKMLAGISLLGTTGAVSAMCWSRREWHDAMFAIRWVIPLMPMVMFWCGAWARRSHGRAGWVVAAILLGWSSIVAILGMTNPVPREGYSGFTASEALVKLFQPAPVMPDTAIAAGR